MMKNFSLVLILLLTSCYQIDRNCQDFKTGTFESTIVIEDKEYTSTFKRTKEIQIETFEGKTDSSSVRWINNCEVVFKTINPKSRIERKDIHLKILTTTATTYTFEYGYVGDTNKQRGEAKRIE